MADIQSFLSQLEIPKISPDIASSLDEPLSLEEIASCILTMKNNKAPGPDSFPADFLNKFHSVIPLIIRVIQSFLRSRLLFVILKPSFDFLNIKKKTKMLKFVTAIDLLA